MDNDTHLGVRPANQAQPGDIILQPNSWDPMSIATAINSLMKGEKPRFTHCGIFVGNGQMMTADGFIRLQDAGADGSIAVKYYWNDWNGVLAWMHQQEGKGYDYLALLMCAIAPILAWVGVLIPRISNEYTCSSFVAAAIIKDEIKEPGLVYQVNKYSNDIQTRTVSPDDIARFLAV